MSVVIKKHAEFTLYMRNQNHTFDFKNIKILDTEKNDMNRSISESFI